MHENEYNENAFAFRFTQTMKRLEEMEDSLKGLHNEASESFAKLLTQVMQGQTAMLNMVDADFHSLSLSVAKYRHAHYLFYDLQEEVLITYGAELKRALTKVGISSVCG